MSENVSVAKEDESPDVPQVRPEDVQILPATMDEHLNGVTPEAVEAIAGMLKKGRRYFGSSGASLTHQVNYKPSKEEQESGGGINPKSARIGLEGERNTTKLLKKWMKDKPGAVLVDSVHIKSREEIETLDPSEMGDEDADADLPESVDEEEGVVDGKDTDHVLIIGNQVILIDTKRWRKKRHYTISNGKKGGYPPGIVLRSGRSFPGGNVRMRGAIYRWLEYLNSEASISAVVVINNEEVTVGINKAYFVNVPYRLVTRDMLFEQLDKLWVKECSDVDRRSINPVTVAQVAMCAIKPDDPFERVFSGENFRKFKETGM